MKKQNVALVFLFDKLQQFTDQSVINQKII